ncbi:MAG TPA: DUF1254 domain-containing protein [Gammaproteobacteria bacterium]|nr:DUF1254 domain-containing protein [Gammaproteobacteria bacterium]
MKQKNILTFTLIAAIALLTAIPQSYAANLPATVITPDKVETRLGTLEFKDGAPNPATVEKLYDNLDFIHGVNTFLNAFQGASTYAIRQGFLSIGAEDNSIVIFSQLMDAKSLFLTANADTVYFLGFVDLSKGPMVVETPPDALGTFDDMWWGWVIDFGIPGPDRGQGGKYLILPPGYNGPLPDSGFHIGRSRTTRVGVLGRMFLINNNPQPAVDTIKKTLKIYPYTPGGYGTSIATLLEGKIKPGTNAPIPETKFIEASGKAFNTLPANDYTFFEQVNALVQEQPNDAFDPEIMGNLTAIGIVKGKPFQPDARMKKILTDAVAVGNATSRMLNFSPREAEGWAYYPNSAWFNMGWVGGYHFETPPPLVTPAGIKPLPNTGARTLNARTAFFYAYTGITPAMIMRLPEVGSQYLLSFKDGDKNYFDGAKTYQVTLPAHIPAGKFWSLTVYDNQSRSMLDTAQRYPRAGSQSYPTPAAVANADGSTTIYFSPALPNGVQKSNWIQTVPGKGWFIVLRLYSPLEAFFSKTWRPTEITEAK